MYEQPNIRVEAVLMMDTDFLALLACPACRGALRAWPDSSGETVPTKDRDAAQSNTGVEALCCEQCRVFYPVREGIPVLLKEEGVAAQTWLAARR